MGRCGVSPRRNRTASSRSPPAAPNFSRARDQGHADGRRGPGRIRLRRRREVPDQHRPPYRPLPTGEGRRLHPPAAGDERPAPGGPLFQSHMLDASTLPLEENLAMAKDLLAECNRVGAILELEIGIVGGKEDAMDHEGVDKAKLYTTPEDMSRTVEVLGLPGREPCTCWRRSSATSTGSTSRARSQLRPTILRDGQAAVEARFGPGRPSLSGLPRRLGIEPGRDPGDDRLRRGEDEHRHRHPVRLHPTHRRSHVHRITPEC